MQPARLGASPDHAEAFAARSDVVLDQGGGDRPREGGIVKLHVNMFAVAIKAALPARLGRGMRGRMFI